MFGIGTGELLLLLLIALLVLGPERLPGLVRDVSRTIQDLRRASDELTTEFMRADQSVTPQAPPALPSSGEGSGAAPEARPERPSEEGTPPPA